MEYDIHNIKKNLRTRRTNLAAPESNKKGVWIPFQCKLCISTTLTTWTAITGNGDFGYRPRHVYVSHHPDLRLDSIPMRYTFALIYVYLHIVGDSIHQHTATTSM